MEPSLPLGPADLGLRISADTTLEDGWLVRDLELPRGLDGPPGILQGGFAAGLTAAIARLVDPFGAPLTSIHARLHAPSPLGERVRAVVRSIGPARYEVETRSSTATLVTAEVELAGQEPPPASLDLRSLASVPLKAAVPQEEYPSCFVCGSAPEHPLGLRLHPRPGPPGTTIQPFVADEALATGSAGAGGGVLDPLVVAAVLDCPTVWAAIDPLRAAGYAGALLAGFRLTSYRDAPIGEPLRIVARCDAIDGRKVHARAALIDEEGTLYALVAAFHVAVTTIPDLRPSS